MRQTIVGSSLFLDNYKTCFDVLEKGLSHLIMKQTIV